MAKKPMKKSKFLFNKKKDGDKDDKGKKVKKVNSPLRI